MDLENTFSEIVTIIKDGPSASRESVYKDILNIILSCTAQEEAYKYFTSDLVLGILKFSGPNSPYNYLVYQILINISSEGEICEQLCEKKDIMTDIVKLSLSEIIDTESKNADYCCMLLANITRLQSRPNCPNFSDYVSSLSHALQKLITVFTTIGYNSKCSLDQLAMVLCNLSQLVEVRDIITKASPSLFQKLVPFMNHENAIRRRGIIGVVHNCAFDSSTHDWMLNDQVDILPRLLLPLAGPEQFDDEDNDKLPVDLQYLPDTKTRESNPDIRIQILETLNQLCATKFGRQFLRDHNTYIILRELHKWEKDPSVILACENVVDILIRTEDEIGYDRLNTVEIPPDLEEKFKNLGP